MSYSPLTFWDRAQLALLRLLSIGLGLLDRLFRVDWGERALERMSRRWENRLEQLDQALARLEQERDQLQDQSEAMAIHAAAIYLAEYAGKKGRIYLKPSLELLAGIPSVVYGFLGVVYIVPVIREQLGGSGFSLLTTSLVLGIMILPTVISISYDALMSVPRSYREGSLAMGATKWQTVYRVVVPSARSGILASFILGMGRAVGETMAVIMVAGNAVKIPISALDSVRTLTANIAAELGEAPAGSDHYRVLFLTGTLLFLITFAVNLAADLVVRGIRRK